MIQYEFAQNAVKVLDADESVIGLTVGGSWLSNQMDEFSDLDLIIVTVNNISDDKKKMIEYASKLGNFLSGFTGEHVGEPRVLICLYDNPLLHVDLKFLTIDELFKRVENPLILLDKGGQIQDILNKSEAKFPYPDYQWIEDRFWIWIHYALLKVGRGELFEAFDFLGFLRMVVLGPFLQIKNGELPRGVRKVEMELPENDFKNLKNTIPNYNKKSLLESLENSVKLYRELRLSLFEETITLQTKTEEKVMLYFEKIKSTI
jgi:hypothetical protein